ncbi:MAG: cytochrome c [Burkholderiaceae bacterium]
MNRIVIVLIVVLLAGAGAYFYLNRPDPSNGQAPAIVGAPPAAEQIARGEYLTKAADCAACHTVAETGKPFAGGVPFVLPFGTIWSSNITADADTGIGNWSDDQFVRALHEGIRNDGRKLYPAFPYTAYTQLSRDDVVAIKAYLFSLPRVAQANKEPDLGFPFNQRWAMGFWNAAFFRSERFVADPRQSPQWNSGAYLAGALGHCAECHTPRNVGFGLEHGNELAGATLQGWRAYNITSDQEYGIGAWTDAEIASYLSTGHAQGRGSAGGPMGEAVAHSLQYLKPEDTAALVTWLRGVPARSGRDPIAVDAKPTAMLASTAQAPGGDSDTPGLKLFEGACASCHQWNGLGQQVDNAALIGTRGVNDPAGTNVIPTILHGAKMRVAGADVYMPAFAEGYSDTEIASLSNYVIGHFGNKKGQVTPDQVAGARRQK